MRRALCLVFWLLASLGLNFIGLGVSLMRNSVAVGALVVGSCVLFTLDAQGFFHGPSRGPRRVANPLTVGGGGDGPRGGEARADGGASRGDTNGTGGKTVCAAFLPGSDGHFAWNTTRPIEERPVLVYLYDCGARDGDDFDYSRYAEERLFANQKVIEHSRGFVCEKICLGNHDWDAKVPGREAISHYLSTIEKQRDAKKLRPQLALLDAEGNPITTYGKLNDLRRGGVRRFLDRLQHAARRNESRFER